MTAAVAIIMGSQSDWATMRHAAETLAALGVAYEKRIVSAHRTPDRLFAFAKGAKAAGFKIIIAGAGGAAHLPGMTAAMTALPVFGVPVESKALSGDRFALFDRPDARRHSGRHAGDRQGRRDQRRAARRQRAGADRRRRWPTRLAAWRKAADRRGRRASGGFGVTASQQVTLKPGDTIGILGGGQLGRMLALAAARLGLQLPGVLAGAGLPAFDVVQNATCAAYADDEALELFAADVDVITYEFENVPAATAMILAARRPVLPEPKVLETTQDRLAEKNFVTRLGIGTAAYADVSSAQGLRAALGKIGLPAVLKTRRFGYDGKGQTMIREGDDLDPVWDDLAHQAAILEAFVPFEREISVIAARGADGEVDCFDVTENEHRDHILNISRVPAAIPDALAAQARGIAEQDRRRARLCRRAGGRDVRGAGRTGRRCWSTRSRRACTIPATGLDGASISQFEQHIRAIAGWPLGKPVRHGQVTMTNLIGDDILDYEQWLTVPGATVHLYGKGTPRPGRKMGHVTEVRLKHRANLAFPRPGCNQKRDLANHGPLLAQAVLPATMPVGSSLSQR